MSDGAIYNTANGTHAFNAPGVYQITVNITTSDGCQATHSESIEVLPATEANFVWESTCSNTNTQFTNTSTRSEEHTSELQSRPHLVCRLLLEKKNEST